MLPLFVRHLRYLHCGCRPVRVRGQMFPLCGFRPVRVIEDRDVYTVGADLLGLENIFTLCGCQPVRVGGPRC